MKIANFKAGISVAIIVTFLVTLSILFGCNKEKEVTSTSPMEDGSKLYSETSDEVVSTSGSRYLVYGARCCTAEGGVSGCQCEIVPDNDNCDQITNCIADPTYPTYDSVYQSMFTDGQIIQRRERKTRITEPALLQALEEDGFPFSN